MTGRMNFRGVWRSSGKNPLVDEFLNAELDFCRMIQEINGKIVEAVNFE